MLKKIKRGYCKSYRKYYISKRKYKS